MLYMYAIITCNVFAVNNVFVVEVMAMTIAESLKRFREEFGVTQRNAAAAVGIMTEAYQKYEYGKHIPSATVLAKLADAYNVSLDYLVGRTNNPHVAEPLK